MREHTEKKGQGDEQGHNGITRGWGENIVHTVETGSMDTKNTGLIVVVDRCGMMGCTEVWLMVRQRRDTGEQDETSRQGDGRATEWNCRYRVSKC